MTRLRRILIKPVVNELDSQNLILYAKTNEHIYLISSICFGFGLIGDNKYKNYKYNK